MVRWPGRRRRRVASHHAPSGSVQPAHLPRQTSRQLLEDWATGRTRLQIVHCDHPADRITSGEFLQYRAADSLVHTWDLARALGSDEALDPDAVHLALSTYVPWVATLTTPGLFGPGPSGDLPEHAPEQQRLLDALGRRP